MKKDLKNADVLNIFFPSLFPGKFCFQSSKVSPKFMGDMYHIQKSITKFRITERNGTYMYMNPWD